MLAVNPTVAKVWCAGVLPLHLVLMQRTHVPGTAAPPDNAAAAAAERLIARLLELHPDGARDRIMVGGPQVRLGPQRHD